MPVVALPGCTATPFGSYLKALGVLRLVADQVDPEARGGWAGETLSIESTLNEEALTSFFLIEYRPTPILAPWNGGSGFYPKDNKDGINALADSSDPRFELYRQSISICRDLKEVNEGKGAEEDERRTAILRRCRNLLPDAAVEWLDAAVGIAADGSRSFAPVLGTGGNEGRLDYTNNFMSRIAALLISPEKGTPVRELLENALFATRTTSLQPGAAGQFDPGRAGGANQGPGVSHDSITNPWDLVLTLEGAVAWASGLYRRQGAGYRSVLCSPFTVRATRVGYGSASSSDDARAEVWTPLWENPVRYRELKALLREGRASVDGRPAVSAIEFAEAACSLGVDRGIGKFVRYSLLKRRGDSYVALPAGTFDARYRSEADRIRQFQLYFGAVRDRGLPRGAEDLERGVESSVFQVLLRGGRDRMRELVRAFGRLLRGALTTSEMRLPRPVLKASDWVHACGVSEPEVRIAAGIASIFSFSREIGSMQDYLSRADNRFSWAGSNLPDRMIGVLTRSLRLATALESEENPTGAACSIAPGDATLFIEGNVDDDAIEDLAFAFLALDWAGFDATLLRRSAQSANVLPAFAVIKHLFLSGAIERGSESFKLRADARILPLLVRGDLTAASAIAVSRLRVAGLRPLQVDYPGGVDGSRLAAALLIPMRSGKALSQGIFIEDEEFDEEEKNIDEPEFA
jgi:CRISPR-associated protein Csx17